MALDRGDADGESRGDLTVRVPGGHQLQDLAFTRRQAVPVGCSGRSDAASHRPGGDGDPIGNGDCFVEGQGAARRPGGGKGGLAHLGPRGLTRAIALGLLTGVGQAPQPLVEPFHEPAEQVRRVRPGPCPRLTMANRSSSTVISHISGSSLTITSPSRASVKARARSPWS